RPPAGVERSAAAARRARRPWSAATTAAPPPAARCRPRRTRCARPGPAAVGDDVRAARRCGVRVPRAGPRADRPWLELRAEAEAEGERRARIVQPARDVQLHRADRRAPAHADADAGVPVGRPAVERAAAVHEHRAAPARVEIALVLAAGGDQVAPADAEVADPRPDLAVVVAADAARAAGVEAQARRQVGEHVGPGVAELAAHDQPRVRAEAAEPARARVQLAEAGVGAEARRRAQPQGAAEAGARIQAVVDVDVFRAQFGEAEAAVAVTRVLEVAGVGPAFAQHVHRRDCGQVRVDLATAAEHELGAAVVHVIGLLVGELQAGGVPAVQPGERRHAVLQGQGLALFRPVDLRQRLVPARVEVAPLHAQAHAGAAFGAEAEAGRVDAARR